MSAPDHDLPSSLSGRASAWTTGLGRAFRRVALFAIDGASARVVAGHGLGRTPLGRTLSLLEKTPLRWAVQAGSPIVGAGDAPGGKLIARVLGLSAPRAFAVIPLVVDEHLVALAYADQEADPLPLRSVGELFTFCEKALARNGSTQAQALPQAEKKKVPIFAVPRRSTASYERYRRYRPPSWCRSGRPPATEACEDDICALALSQEEQAEIGQPEMGPSMLLGTYAAATEVVVEAALEELPVAAAGAPRPGSSRPEYLVVTPDGVVTFDELHKTRRPRVAARLGACAAGIASAVLAALALTAPVAPSATRAKLVHISPGATVAAIGTELEEAGLVRSSRAFLLAARLSGVDSRLKAGVYRLPRGEWLWTVLAELYRGQVHTTTVTLPEGLTLADVGRALEQQGLASAESFVREASSPALLARYGIKAPSAEGFLFPDTYTLAEGLSSREILEVLLDQFFSRLRALPGGAELSGAKLAETVVLASIVEREAKRDEEMARVAGVFHNRLGAGMRLESCATVQYALGRPKARLTLADVRVESPYNTYLHPGLPPGAIGAPGLAALRAAIAPEEHAYLFFFAREDGTGRHVFSKTYAEHQRLQGKARADARVDSRKSKA